MRTLAAAIIAPLAVIPILLILFGPWALDHGGARSMIGIVTPAVIVAYPLLIMFGLPMHLALDRQGYRRARDYGVAGALLGAIPVIGYVVVAVMFEAKFAVSAMPAAAIRNLEWGSIGVVVFGLCGTAIGLTFRAFAISRNT
jgi:hypothetical protein